MTRKKIIYSKIITLLKYILIFIIVYFFMSLWQSQGMQSGKAPDIDGLDVTNKYISTKTIREKPLLVYFWAPWCGICNFTFQSIKNISNDYKVITIALDYDNITEIKEFIEGREVLTIADSSGKIKQDWGVKGVPSYFIVGKEDQIKLAKVGYMSEIHLRLYLALQD
tara:strand:+ start:25636 stop:26136 length:501 start_codon:yes stop_codon:yes gene_type:complete